MKSGRINLRLGPHAEAWQTACDARNETPAEGALRLIKQSIVRDRWSPAAPNPTTPQQPSSPTVDVRPMEPRTPDPQTQVRLGRERYRFTASELAAIANEAERAGFHNVQAWIVAAVRGALTQAPQFSETELRQLTESTRNVGAVGRNLNQLVRAINTSAPELVKVRTEDIDQVRDVINTEVRNLRAVIQASTERWPLVAAK